MTQSAARFLKVEADPRELLGYVSALRCGLDAAAWDDGLRGPYRPKLHRRAPESGKPLPFDHARAHRLYQALFGQVEDLIKGKQLLIVPSGPLTQLPFQVLVTAAPAGAISKGGLADPRACADRAARGLLAQGAAPRGTAERREQAHDRLRQSAARRQSRSIRRRRGQGAPNARATPALPDTAWQRVASLWRARGVAPAHMRGGLADVEFLRRQAPLPETADELCEVARDLGADPGEIRLGARATEREVKRLSESGSLRNTASCISRPMARLRARSQGNSEPGLILTPPDDAERGG